MGYKNTTTVFPADCRQQQIGLEWGVLEAPPLYSLLQERREGESIVLAIPLLMGI